MIEFRDEETEIWVTARVDGYEFPDYIVSNKGRLYSLRSNKLITGTHTYNGYVRVKLRLPDGTVIQKPIHRIVAQCFCENSENKPYVNHIDGDKDNNNPHNLEWVTCKENTKHAIDTGLIYTVGEKSHFSSIDEETAHEICRLFETTNMTCKEIANKLNIGLDCVKKIHARRSWKHVSIHYNF